MRAVRRRVLGVALGLAVQAGCTGIPETSYFMLSAVPVGAPESTPASHNAASITVATVRLPGVLDRSQIVTATSANTVTVREFDRWAEPLDQMVRRVLREDVAQRPAGHPRGVARIAVQIDEFMGHADGTARLAGQWWLMSDTDGTHPGSVRTFQFQVATGSADMSSTALALSRLLGQLAADIAGTELL